MSSSTTHTTESEPEIYYEDIEVGSEYDSPWYVVERDEVIEMASRWDPYPFHLDEKIAKRSLFGGLAACTPHIFAISVRLSHTLPGPLALIAGLGGGGLHLLAPVRVGGKVRLTRRFTDARVSKSRPDAGIVSVEDTLYTPEGDAVFRTSGSMLIAKRNA
ncbi:MAG: MaoC family dehydratase N-terminal domain-containing protein [Deltaproteobacteria bacterium]|jgi:acyl dehydratase|nr:MaoC family dehydratase N-terminal domain-containing protein [Deltaproteobacteria bacterium]MBW2496288.1 MaoC family dehydratase N-terminal domain-containing protein [Deltaproteobacteria bacterium]